MSFKPLCVATILLLLIGCDEITEVYLEARKDMFYPGSVVYFDDLQNNTQVNLIE
jgi:hypothetical protein